MTTATPLAATQLCDRALIRLSGDDVRGFLQGLVTNDVRALEAGPVAAGLLSAQGKALFDFLLWADGADVLIDCEATQAEALTRRLTLYRLRRALTIAPEPGLAVHWSAAPDGPGQPDPRLAALGRRWLAAPGGAPADAAWRAHRLGLGVTEGVAELGQDKTLWLETNAGALNGVSFTKGCYVGQENTARMNWRQKVNRRLVVVACGEDPGEAARIWYPALGQAVALVRVEQIATGIGWGRIVMPDWLAAALAEPAA
ncbi:CAF17-like 4Fe-4S cluster assembly/insertion protein YgfZ [Sphingomonas morindae]|uniref:Folate-binding protein n=1 Tax=Sphingomonas morindae TaxID=1541170 RepID=A0ABY4X865_9SPHN|nr:folate-binding protein [Sphingomonas morindae]USI73139.1 folate-binding protein [Sphingomonas morindae]